MKQTFLHRPKLDVQAEFVTEKGREYRYRLEITRQGTPHVRKTVCAIMQNPSYAGVEVADKSVQALERVVFEQGRPEFRGVDRLIIVNLFAFIQTNGFVGGKENVGKRNDEVIEEAIRESDIILVAWGRSNGDHDRQSFVLDLTRKTRGKRLLCTSRHPSRVIYKGFIRPFSDLKPDPKP